MSRPPRAGRARCPASAQDWARTSGAPHMATTMCIRVQSIALARILSGLKSGEIFQSSAARRELCNFRQELSIRFDPSSAVRRIAELEENASALRDLRGLVRPRVARGIADRDRDDRSSSAERGEVGGLE